MILVTPKQEIERKSEWFCGVKFFRSNFKVEWKYGVWTKIRFIGSGFLFTCGNFTLIFTVFSVFWIGFFSKWFCKPFIVRSRSSFLFSQWKFFELYVRTCPAMFSYLCQPTFEIPNQLLSESNCAIVVYWEINELQIMTLAEIFRLVAN